MDQFAEHIRVFKQNIEAAINKEVKILESKQGITPSDIVIHMVETTMHSSALRSFQVGMVTVRFDL